MPIYEYQCQGCGAKCEVKQKLSDAPLTTCERCGGALTKLISAPGIMFKGSGWYITDYSDKMKPPTDSKSDKSHKTEQPAAEASTSASSSESKPAEKPAAASSSPASTTTPAASSSSSGSGTGTAKSS